MKKLLVILILGMLSCKKEIPNIVIPAPQTKIVDTITQTKKINYQSLLIQNNFDKLILLSKNYTEFGELYKNLVGSFEKVNHNYRTVSIG